ncbi:MAG: prepilin-type N-terminal cleavage/methylation domain-containing protein [Phycisphaeraceae bacterium]|nr:prepilin-type N-terminal cleavage/methylation domain-containing protein [Phycisphaeraceae bacterium]
MNRLRHCQAFTLVELLMALAISTLLLTGLGVAFNASMVSYNVNKDTYEGLNNARLALARMVSELRTGYDIIAPGPGASSSQCDFSVDIYDENGIWVDEKEITYEYRSAVKTIVTYFEGIRDPNYVLCRNVEWAEFELDLDGKSVHIDLTVSSGDIQQEFAQSVAIRRNLE